MPAATARAVLLVCLLLLGASRAQAVPIGTFHEGTDDYAEIVFSFSPLPGPATDLILGLGGSVTKLLSGCVFQLFDGGGLISSATRNSSAGCQGRWSSDSGAGHPDLIDANVDLSGLRAGETGMLRMTPLFVAGPPGENNLDTPFLYLDSSPGSISSQGIVAMPEPALAPLLLGGLAAVTSRRRARGSAAARRAG